MKITISFIAFFFIILPFSFAQKPETIDSLKKVLKSKLNEKERIDTYNELANQYDEVDLEKTNQYASKAMKLSKSNSYPQGIADAHYHLGTINLVNGNFSIATDNYKKSKTFAQKASDDKRLGNAYNGIASVFWYQGQYPEARASYQKALKNYKKVKYSSGVATCYNNIGALYQNSNDFKQALKYYLKASKINKKIGKEQKVATNYQNMGQIYEYFGNNSKALFYYNKSLEVYKKLNDSLNIATLYNNLAVVKSNQGNYPESIKYYFKSLKLYEKLGNEENVAYSYNNIGTFYEEQDDFRKALKYYFKSLKIHKKQNTKYVTSTYINIAQVYKRLKDYKKSESYYKKALSLGKKNDNDLVIAYSYRGIGNLFLKHKKYKKAKNHIEKAIDIFTNLGVQNMIAESLYDLGVIDYEIKNIKKSVSSLERSLKIALEIKNLAIIRKVTGILSKAYQIQGNYKKAYENQVLFKQMSDSLNNEDNTRKIARLEAQYEYDKKEQKLKLKQAKKEYKLNQKIQQQTYLLYGIALALFFLIVIAVIYYRYSKRLKELNATKDKLFAIVAHDLKNPLSAFRSITQSLSENITAISKEEIQYFLDKINKSSSQLYNLLQNLLQWAVNQTGQLEYKPQKLDLQQVSQDVKEQLQTNAEVKEIKLENKINENITAFADNKMTTLIIRNLVSNAIKFTPKAGSVTIEAENKDKEVEIKVKDTGIGISKTDQAKLFKVEEDSSKIGSSSEKGTGLGLILCKELVEKQGGKIWVESEEGKGSSFIFTLPKD